MMTDPIADMLTRIRNANTAMHDDVKMPSSKQKRALATVLKAEGYIEDFAVAQGASRGGLPGGDQIERNLRLWEAMAAAGDGDVRALARAFVLDAPTVRTALLRMRAAAAHLGVCRDGSSCAAGPAAKQAHRHAALLEGLPPIEDRAWQRIARG